MLRTIITLYSCDSNTVAILGLGSVGTRNSLCSSLLGYALLVGITAIVVRLFDTRNFRLHRYHWGIGSTDPIRCYRTVYNILYVYIRAFAPLSSSSLSNSFYAANHYHYYISMIPTVPFAIPSFRNPCWLGFLCFSVSNGTLQ
jgi:hypothetical protein